MYVYIFMFIFVYIMFQPARHYLSHLAQLYHLPCVILYLYTCACMYYRLLVSTSVIPMTMCNDAFQRFLKFAYFEQVLHQRNVYACHCSEIARPQSQRCTLCLLDTCLGFDARWTSWSTGLGFHPAGGRKCSSTFGSQMVQHSLFDEYEAWLKQDLK